MIVTRLRAILWELLDAHVSTSTLADIALAAHAWHRLHGPDRATESWRTVRLQLQSLFTLTAPDPEIRNLVRALVSALLADEPDGDARTTSAAFADLATTSLLALQHLQTSGDLWISADALTGLQVTDDPTLAAAKLRHALVPAHPEDLHVLTVAYRTAALAPHDPLE